MLKEYAKSVWAPPPRLTSWQWCEQNVFLPPQASPRPGRYSTNITPYVRGVFEAFDDPRTEEIVLCWGAQTSKTMTMLCLMAYVIGNAPSNMIWMMPSADLAQSFVETRFAPIMEASPALKKKLPADRHKNKLLEKHLEGMTLNFVGGNSPANLASRSAAVVMGDEVDKLERSLGRESCPMELLSERQKWFRGRRKTIWASTPTTIDWKIWPRLIAGTFERLFWPCPHCHEKFVPTWRMMKWRNEDSLSNEEKALTAYIECPHCQGRFEDRNKRKALQEAEWRATNPNAHPKRVRSFHICEIQSPLSTFKDMVLYFLVAKDEARRGDFGKLQNFINSRLAEVWQEGGYSKRDKDAIKMLKTSSGRGIVPRETLALVAGCDTQDDGFWYSVRAWKAESVSQLVQEGFVKSLADLEQVLWGQPWFNIDGVPHRILQTLIDTGGHRMDEVNNWCFEHMSKGVMPCLGVTKQNHPYAIRPIDQDKINSQMRVKVDTTYFKDLLSEKLKIQVGDPGEFRCHGETSEDYFDQMITEYKDPQKRLWVNPPHGQNHLWDCEVYALCAAYMIDCLNIKQEDANDNPYAPIPTKTERPEPTQFW
jgi:phage terminase large subunit GpA-like protein